LATLVACSVVPRSEIPASAQNPPNYPNAQQVKTEEEVGARKIITFQTSDAPADVCTYYRDTLAKDGWSQVECASGSKAITGNFEWLQTDLNGPTDVAYRIVLTAKAIESGQTSVKLDLSEFDPR